MMRGGVSRRGDDRARQGRAVGAHRASRRVLFAGGACVVGVAALAVAGLAHSLAQDAQPPADEAPAAASPGASPAAHAKKPEHRHHHPAPARKAEAPTAAETAPKGTIAPATAAQPGAGAPAAANIFDAQLVKAGATTCAARVSQMAAISMQGVATVGTASNWFAPTPDKRPVTLLLGQKYAAAGVPEGATAVIAAPQPDGRCDAVSVQVVPSPLPCARLRDDIAKRGKELADLAGVPLMQDAQGQTLLVPTGAGSCVLVGVRSAYAK